MPEGHAEIVRQLVVPVMREGRIAAILGVGNKPTDYTQKDVEIVSYLADVTWEIIRQKQAEEMLQESEERYRIIAEDSPIGIYVSDEERFIYVNPRLCEITGFSREELLNMPDPVERLVMPEEREKALDNAMRRLRGESAPVGYEVRGIRKDEEEIVLGLTVTLISLSGKRVLYGAVEDATKRKQMEDTLRESERMYRALFEQNNDAVFLLDLDGNHLTANQRAVDMLGYTLEEIIGMPFTDVVAPTEHPQSFEVLKALKAGQKIRPYERIFRKKSGENIPVEVNVELVRDEDGNPLHIQSIARDITERKQVNEQLRERERALRSIFENMQDGYYRADLQGRVLWATPSAATMLGYDSPDKLIGSDIANEFYAYPEKREDFLRELNKMGRLHGYEIEIRRQDGGILVVSANVAFYQEDSKIVGIEGSIRDITKQKQAEKALVDERTLLDTILNNLPIQVYVKDTESRFVFANATTMRDLGAATREEYVGKTDFDFMSQSPEEALAYLVEEQAIIQTGEAMLNKEHKSFTIDDTQKWSVTSKLPIHDTEENITGIVGIGIDITERKQMEQRERELAVERERVKILGSFIQAVSQEFRTPLSIINTRLYLLERVTEEEKRPAQIEIIKEQTAYLGELVEAILTIASLESGIKFHLAPLDLNQLVRNVETRYRLWIEKKAISFHIHFGYHLPLVHGDREELQRALTNIIRNAIDYTPDGGVVTIRTYARKDFVVAEIKDTGIGISEGDLPYIFDPFYRADEARTARKAGLGLSIAHKIIELHQGNIEAKSELGKGSTFIISLPIKPPLGRAVGDEG
jgi:PAS domain S-box-containing protein